MFISPRELERSPSPIESARDLNSSIQIIPKEICDLGLVAMKSQFDAQFPDPNLISVIPIKNGGNLIGNILQPDQLQQNPMQVSNYGEENQRLDEPRILESPDINKIINPDGTVRSIVFAEAVVDSQGTIIVSIDHNNSMIDTLNQQDTSPNLPYPEYHTYTFVSKTEGNPVEIPNLTAMFKVNPAIWVYGLGCDDEGKRRSEEFIGGRLSPFAEGPPLPPYAEALFDLDSSLIPLSYSSLITTQS